MCSKHRNLSLLPFSSTSTLWSRSFLLFFSISGLLFLNYPRRSYYLFLLLLFFTLLPALLSIIFPPFLFFLIIHPHSIRSLYSPVLALNKNLLYFTSFSSLLFLRHCFLQAHLLPSFITLFLLYLNPPPLHIYITTTTGCALSPSSFLHLPFLMCVCVFVCFFFTLLATLSHLSRPRILLLLSFSLFPPKISQISIAFS